MTHDTHPALLGGNALRPEGPPGWPPQDPEVAEALQTAVQTGSWGRYHGPQCEQLAERLAAYHQARHAVLCCSGTAAVELALRGLKVEPGDEVILAAYDFQGNFQNVLRLGATPVLTDIAPANWNLDPDRLAEAFSPKTRAVLVSHLHGGMVPMAAVMEQARERGVPVIEDACQMPGATIDGRMAGRWGDVGILSFGGSKLLSAGSGGALITDDDEIKQRSRLYTQRGNEAYPLSELQATVLIPQLRRLDERNRRRSEAVAHLHRLLQERPGLRPFQNPTSNYRPGYYKVGFQYEADALAGLPRDVLAQAMRAEGIALDPGFRALHRIHSRRRYRAVGELPHADEADRRVLVLHHPVLLGEQSDIEQIVAALDKIRHAATMIQEMEA